MAWKGKIYYDNGKIKFDGNYLNGKIWKGKNYNNEGKLIFDGEFVNGQRLKGKEIEYNINGKMIYDGGLLNGKRHGKVIEYYTNGKIACSFLHQISNTNPRFVVLHLARKIKLKRLGFQIKI